MTGGGGKLEALRAERSGAFRKETIPYVRYLGLSGFPAFLSLIVISSALGYFKLIRDLPPQFPVTAVGVAALTLVLCWSPLRTFLAPADIVFLMPREGQMGDYMGGSFRSSAILTGVLCAAVLALYLPIYNQGEGVVSGAVLVCAAAAIRAGNLRGAWQERRMAWPGMRLFIRLCRWLATALLLAAWLTFALWQAAAFTLLVAALFVFVYRLPASHRFPWERLIVEEKTTRKRYYVFFGMFIDVPTLPSRVARRPYLSWLLRAVPYSNRNTFVYLYLSSLLRTEIGGIVVRLLVLGALVAYWAADAASLSGWAASLVYALFMTILSAQIGALRHVHRHSVWKHVYPLPDQQRARQYAKVDRMALLAIAALLWLPLGVPLLIRGLYVPAAAAAIGALAYLAIRPARLRAKLQKEEDDD